MKHTTVATIAWWSMGAMIPIALIGITSYSNMPTTTPTAVAATVSASQATPLDAFCALRKQYEATWFQINDEERHQTDLARAANESAFKARYTQATNNFVASANPLLSGVPFTLSQAKVEPDEGLRLDLEARCILWVHATIAPTPAVVQQIATVNAGTTLRITAQLNAKHTAPREMGLYVSSITLPDNSTIATQPSHPKE